MSTNGDIKTAMSEDFALKIVECYNYLCKDKKEFTMSTQLLRAGTSIGANIAESIYAESTLDFIHKLKISQKEASETRYWLNLLYKVGYLTTTQYESLISDCNALLRILSSIIKKSSSNNNL